jgi:hypothetical protein
MPVVPVTAGSSAALPAGAATAGGTITTLNVNPLAPDLFAVAGLLWNGGVDASGATFGVEFDGVAMDDYATVSMASNHHQLKAFVLDDPNSGPNKTVEGSFSGMGTELVTRNLMMVVAVYAGVDSAGDPVTAGNTSPMVNRVTVDSVAEAHRPVFIHCVDGLNIMTGYDKIARAHQKCAGLAGGDLLIGDAAGASSVVSTATPLISITQLWGAIGFNLIPAPVMVDVVLYMSSVAMEARAGLFRTATPPPDRFYKIPGNPPVND